MGMNLSASAKQQGVSYQTDWRLGQPGKLPRAPGTVWHGQCRGAVSASPAVRSQKVAVYARVSSAQNRLQLESQAERVAAFSAAKGWQVHRSSRNLVAASTISVRRSSRFGVACIRTLLKTQSRELIDHQ